MRRALFLAALGLLTGCDSLLGYDEIRFDGGSYAGRYGNGGRPEGGAPSAGAPNGGGQAGSLAGAPNGGVPNGGSPSGGAPSGGAPSGGESSGGAWTGGGGGSNDPLEQARQMCVDHINQLRATKGLAPYQRWSSAESCVDQQATADEQSGSPHGAFISQSIPCNGYGYGQDECLGGGAAGIVSCLDMMWAEKDQPGCAGCDACSQPGGCANCDFYGSTTGYECGHYVNMSAKWFSMVACGYSSLGGWAAQNFQ